MVVPWNEVARAADEEVQVRALVGLQHMVDVELPVAAGERRLRRLPLGAALREFGVGVEVHQIDSARMGQALQWLRERAEPG